MSVVAPTTAASSPRREAYLEPVEDSDTTLHGSLHPPSGAQAVQTVELTTFSAGPRTPPPSPKGKEDAPPQHLSAGLERPSTPHNSGVRLRGAGLEEVRGARRTESSLPYRQGPKQESPPALDAMLEADPSLWKWSGYLEDWKKCLKDPAFRQTLCQALDEMTACGDDVLIVYQGKSEDPATRDGDDTMQPRGNALPAGALAFISQRSATLAEDFKLVKLLINDSTRKEKPQALKELRAQISPDRTDFPNDVVQQLAQVSLDLTDFPGPFVKKLFTFVSALRQGKQPSFASGAMERDDLLRLINYLVLSDTAHPMLRRLYGILQQAPYPSPEALLSDARTQAEILQWARHLQARDPSITLDSVLREAIHRWARSIEATNPEAVANALPTIRKIVEKLGEADGLLERHRESRMESCARVPAPVSYFAPVLAVVYVLLVPTVTVAVTKRYVPKESQEDVFTLSIAFWALCMLATLFAAVGCNNHWRNRPARAWAKDILKLQNALKQQLGTDHDPVCKKWFDEKFADLLVKAAWHNNDILIKYCCRDLAVDPNQYNAQGEFPLTVAERRWAFSALSELRRQGARLENAHTTTATNCFKRYNLPTSADLIRALEEQNSFEFFTLLPYVVNVNAPTQTGELPLTYAIRHGAEPRIVQALILAGADPRASCHHGTALEVVDRPITTLPARAATQSHDGPTEVASTELTRHLLKIAIAAEETGFSPLTQAIRERHDASVIQIMLDAGADPNAYAQGITPLLAAVEADRTDIVELILHAGADPNRPSDEPVFHADGRLRQTTPLREAVKAYHRTETIQALVNAGADPNWCPDGALPSESPLGVAEQRGLLWTVRRMQ